MQTTENTQSELRILRLPAVRAKTGYPTTTIYDKMKRGEFPRATGKPDVDRGIRLAHHAYQSRTGREPPPIKSMHFESEGASYAGGGAAVPTLSSPVNNLTQTEQSNESV